MNSEAYTPNTPTLGIELEVPWRTMLKRINGTAAELLAESEGGFYGLPQPEKEYVQAAMNVVDDQYKTKIAEAEAVGIPKSGNDGYVEFALQPRDTTTAIIADVQTLYDIGILQNNERYPLHITIGGIAAKNSVSYLLCSAEIIGNIRPERIMQHRTWNVKGQGGMKKRLRHELDLGATSGVEFRTLEHTSLPQLEEILSVTHIGAKAINDRQELWQSWCDSLMAHLRQVGLPTSSLWGNTDRELWSKYANALRNNDWRYEAQRIIGRHVALLELLSKSS